MQSYLFGAEYLSCTHLQLTPVHHFVDQSRSMSGKIKSNATIIVLSLCVNNLFCLVININCVANADITVNL